MVCFDAAGRVGGVDVEGVQVGADLLYWAEALGKASSHKHCFSSLFMVSHRYGNPPGRLLLLFRVFCWWLTVECLEPHWLRSSLDPSSVDRQCNATVVGIR